MGAIDDTRKLLQDLITPDLKALEAQVVALEDKMDLKFAELEKRIELKFDTATSIAAANHAAIMYALDIRTRVERLESERNPPKGLDRPT